MGAKLEQNKGRPLANEEFSHRTAVMDTHLNQENEPNFKRDPQPIVKQLEQGPLAWLLHKAQELVQVEIKVLELLEPEARGHCRLMNVTPTVLTLEVDNAAWATRLRYEAQNLRKQLNTLAEFQYVQEIQFKVRPVANLPNSSLIEASPKKAQSLSVASKSLIEETAQGIKDPKLKEALLRLAR